MIFKKYFLFPAGPYKVKMDNLMNIPEPALPFDPIRNLQFKRRYDGRQSIRFSDSVESSSSPSAKRSDRKAKDESDKLWKSLRTTSRSGLY